MLQTMPSISGLLAMHAWKDTLLNSQWLHLEALGQKERTTASWFVPRPRTDSDARVLYSVSCFYFYFFFKFLRFCCLPQRGKQEQSERDGSMGLTIVTSKAKDGNSESINRGREKKHNHMKWFARRIQADLFTSHFILKVFKDAEGQMRSVEVSGRTLLVCKVMGFAFSIESFLEFQLDLRNVVD